MPRVRSGCVKIEKRFERWKELPPGERLCKRNLDTFVKSFICYHRGRPSERWDEGRVSTGLALHPTPDRRCPAYRAHPLALSILLGPGKVAGLQTISHFQSLPNGALGWVRRKEGRPH